MNTRPFSRWFRVFALVGSLAQPLQQACAQPIQLTNAQVSNSQIQFNVSAPTNAYYRVDSSTDLITWLPVDYYHGTSALHTTSDSFARTNQAVFYRARRVNPGLAIIDFNLGAVTPGQQLEIYGQFLPPLSQYSVQIGGITTPIVSGTSARLFVTVPAGAATGLLTISNFTGEMVAATEALCILSNAVVRFQPPAGLATTGFTVENEYGSGVLLSNTGTSTASFSLPVPEGFPTAIESSR
jgi:hypothetical protein